MLPVAPARCIRRASLLLALAVVWPATAHAEPTKLVLIPLGQGPAFEPTMAVAQALARRMQRPSQRTTQLAYFAPEPPEPANLKNQEKQASKALKKAFASYELMEYDKVKVAASEALKIYKDLLKSNYRSAADGYLTCQHLLGASALLQGENREAFEAMNDAALFDPRPPSKRLFNPSVQELFEQVRAEPAPNGTVVLQSTPTAVVWFNGTLHGLARGRATLRSGLYLVRFYLPGYAMQQRWFRVKAHQERPLRANLVADGQPESETLTRLREESRAEEPGAAVSQTGLDLAAEDVLLITAGKSCAAASCPVRLAWAREGKWHRRRQAVFTGQPEPAAAALTGAKVIAPAVPAPPPETVVTEGVRACTLDNQCYMNERCRQGVCARPKSVARTWWFWTLMGAAAAGVTLAIVLPLTWPEGPTIEVR